MGTGIALLGTFETKAEELLDLESALVAEGLDVTRMDLSLESGGTVMAADAKLARMRDRAERVAKTVSGNMPAAVVGVGGGTGSEMVLQAMQPLPLDLPKFLVTTLPFDPRGNLADCPVTLIPSPCDIQGMNSTLRQIFARTAAMVASVVDERIRRIDRRKAIAVSLLGSRRRPGKRPFDCYGLPTRNIDFPCVGIRRRGAGTIRPRGDVRRHDRSDGQRNRPHACRGSPYPDARPIYLWP